jgi:hypothetical protein
MKAITYWLLTLTLSCIAWMTSAQRIILDNTIRAGGLTLFADYEKPNEYYYLVDRVSLATNAQGNPQFSFLKFADNKEPVPDSENTESDGGGIFHAVVTLTVGEEVLDEARRDLRSQNSSGVIKGPVIYDAGKFGLVSSFKDENGDLTSKLVGLGNAPLIDGHKAAISIRLTKLGAKVLWESFKTPAPDIFFQFEMEISGYRAPKRAIIEADFDQIYEHKSFNIGAASAFFAGEINTSFEDLQRSGAIKVTQFGADENMEALINTAYNKLTEMMFTPMNGTGVPGAASLTSQGGSGSSMMDRAGQMFARERQLAQSRSSVGGNGGGSGTSSSAMDGATASASDTSGSGGGYQPGIVARQRGIQAPTEGPASASSNDPVSSGNPAIAIMASYQMKSVRQRGKFKIDLNKYTVDKKSFPFGENIGDLRKYIDDDNYFREVNLDDPTFLQREVAAILDVSSMKDFAEIINFVNVRLYKDHGNGKNSSDEIRITRDNFNQSANNFKMMYGWKSDPSRRDWRNYEYEVDWSLIGGHTISEKSTSTSSNAISLTPPYYRRQIEIQVDPAIVSEKGIRAINVKVYSMVEGKERISQVDLNTAGGELSKKIEFLSPQGEINYDYEIGWRHRGNVNETSGRQSGSETILFADEL